METNQYHTEGVLEIIAEQGHGFLRSKESNYLKSDKDVYIAPSQIKFCSLRTGDIVGVLASPPTSTSEKNHKVMFVETINGIPVNSFNRGNGFEKLTATFPTEQFVLENGNKQLTTRLLDIVAPIGKGAANLIVAPAKAGKTTILKTIASTISENYPDSPLSVLLIDERQAEVTDIRDSIKGEVISADYNLSAEEHVKVANIVLEKAKRQVEMGKDVVILVDSMTRFVRACNNLKNLPRKLSSGGLNTEAIRIPRNFFQTASKFKEGGSLTIIATVLVETGSPMDRQIFDELKASGSGEIFLDRNIAQSLVFPALDIHQTSIRNEEKMLSAKKLLEIRLLRENLVFKAPREAIKTLISVINKTESNEFLLERLDK